MLHYTICHSKQLQEGLMVFSDDFLHFLKIKRKKVEFTKTILWLNLKKTPQKMLKDLTTVS